MSNYSSGQSATSRRDGEIQHVPVLAAWGA